MLNSYLCKAITSIRRAKRLSRTTAALRAGVSNSTWSLWENGDRAPRAEGIRQICQGLGCSSFELQIKVNQLHTEELTEQAAKIGAAPPAHNTRELIAKAERLMKLDVSALPEEMQRAFKNLRNFGIVLSTQYQPLINSIVELHMLVRRVRD